MRAHIAPAAPGNHHQLFLSFLQTLERIDPLTAVVKGGFAYATLGGVQHFIALADAVGNWRASRKEFLIGIHHAITEPSALERLRNLPNSTVRAFVPGSRLQLNALYAKPTFHPKVLAISNVDGGNLRLLQAGSANLTSSAIAAEPKNFEFSLAISATGPATIDQRRAFQGWWTALWAQSTTVDTTFIRRYAELRVRVQRENPILRFAAEPPAGMNEARYFFFEVGAASGPPGYRHQIEFPEALVRFFGAVRRRRRDITLRRRDVAWQGRPLSYKRTTFGVEIWRLGMPTQKKGGDPIAGRVIRFERTPIDGTFDFEVTDIRSREYESWTRSANIRGHIGATHGRGSRVYGFY